MPILHSHQPSPEKTPWEERGMKEKAAFLARNALGRGSWNEQCPDPPRALLPPHFGEFCRGSSSKQVRRT